MAHAYFFEQDIEVLTVITPPDVNLDIYTLVPGPVSIEDNTITLVPQLRTDVNVDDYRKRLWKTAYDQLDVFYKKYTDETPEVEQASWSLQLAEANYVKAYFESPDIMPADQTPVLELMVSQRKVPNETVFDLAKLVLAAANRYATIVANLVGQWQRVDKALRAATTVEELVAVDTAIIDPAEKKM